MNQPASPSARHQLRPLALVLFLLVGATALMLWRAEPPAAVSEEVMEDLVGKKIVFRDGWDADANYLLLKNDKSFYYNVHTGYAPSWWPEYDIDLGPYLQTPTQNLADLLVPGTTSLYAREFEKGLVLVNPGSLEQQYTLSDTLGRYAFSGGGSLVEGQKPDMELEVAQEVSGKIAVPPGRGMILSREIGR